MHNPFVAGTQAPTLRRQARAGSITYRLAYVFYVGGMISFFGSLGQAIVSLSHVQPVHAGVWVLGGFAGWWLCAGIALRLGVSVSAFFTRLGAFLDR